jgi:hypothetical protein
MASTYTPLKIQLMATGENTGTWGNVTNTNLEFGVEEALVGSVDITFASADVTLTLTNTNSTQPARHLRLNLVGTVSTAQNLILGSGCQIEKIYIINNTLNQTITVKNTTGTGIAVPAGKTMYVYNNGTNVVDAITHLTSLTLASALPVASGGTGATTLNGLTFTGENITNLNASNISSGTLANARTTASASNGASTIVARDASGNFSANTVTANLSGNVTGNVTGNLTGTASNAATLQTARNFQISGGATAANVLFDGSVDVNLAVTALNASAIDSGTIANARTTASSSNGANTIVQRDASGNFSANIITASGESLTSLNASNISSGTLANARTTASSSNGANTIISRDASGNFSANTMTGTAANATILQTARNFEISGGATAAAVSFNGSANVNLNVTALNASSISSGTLSNARTTASSTNGSSTIVLRDGSGSFSANTITANISGNVTGNLTGTASNATVLQNARTIAISGGATGTATSFNGSANITIPVTGLNVSTADAGTLAVSRGGTGASTLTANNVLLGNGTSALQVVAPGTSGNVLSSNGTTWISAGANTVVNTTNVLTATGSASVGAVGTYAFMRYDVSAAPGTTAAGSSLYYTSIWDSAGGPSSVQPSGTWRIMGENANRVMASMWLRIA